MELLNILMRLDRAKRSKTHVGLKNTLAGLTPDFVIEALRNTYIRAYKRRLDQKLERLKGKDRIKVLFVCPDLSSFALEDLFRRMLEDTRFDPVIGISLYDHMDPKVGTIREKEAYAERHFKDKGEPYCVFGDTSEEIEKALLQIRPDVVFYSCTMYLRSMREILKHSKDSINIYVSYGYFLSNTQDGAFNNEAVNRMDYVFWEAPMTVQMSRTYACNKGCNSYFLGYPKLDGLVGEALKRDADVWKRQDKEKKRIIWAPHHSFEHDEHSYGYSCFLELSSFMLEIAGTYRDQIQLAFKPHPILKTKLYNAPEWGKEKTDAYYHQWEEIPNCQAEYGDYKDLFVTSDAMIMDSISFMCEYTATNKPCLFTVRDETISNKFNELGVKVFENALYRTGEDLKSDIVSFIENVVIKGNDTMEEARNQLVSEELFFPQGKSASRNILEFIADRLGE